MMGVPGTPGARKASWPTRRPVGRAASDLRLGSSRDRTAVMLERGFRGHLIWRENLTFDTRFTARSPSSRPAGHLYVLLDDWGAAGLSRPCLVDRRIVDLQLCDITSVVGCLATSDFARVFATAGPTSPLL